MQKAFVSYDTPTCLKVRQTNASATSSSTPKYSKTCFLYVFGSFLLSSSCAKIVPNDKYLIETDSPFLAPVPHRGKRNEPAFVENVAHFMADLRSTELITIAKESSKNAEDLFKFDL